MTIEERANLVTSLYSFRNGLQGLKEAYMMGCTSGKVDAIEEAVKWFKNKWRDYLYIDKDGTICFSHWKDDFIKAMEEDE